MWFLGANVYVIIGIGDIVLIYVCENGYIDVAEVLLEYGVELVIIFYKEIKKKIFYLIYVSMYLLNLIM